MIAVRISDDVAAVTVAAPSYIARHGKLQTPHDLARHECIRIRFASGALISWRMRLGRRVVEVPVEGRFIVNDDRMAIQAALEGAGLLHLPRASSATARLATALSSTSVPARYLAQKGH
jgi:DNA-binding transcriptional LysR family regulator